MHDINALFYKARFNIANAIHIAGDNAHADLHLAALAHRRAIDQQAQHARRSLGQRRRYANNRKESV